MVLDLYRDIDFIYSFIICLYKDSKKADEKIEGIYKDSIGHLLNSATRAYDEGHFEKGDSIMDRIDMLIKELILLKQTKTSQKRRAKR